MSSILLGVNIDHVATLRQARGTRYPDPVQAAIESEQAGADSVTLHLREDRRHIQERDVELLSSILQTRMNLEMAATPEMLRIATRIRPRDCCLVPEKREELTTEGGLDVAGNEEAVAAAVRTLTAVGIRVSLFIDPDRDQLLAARSVRAPVVELHTGTYADALGAEQAAELERLHDAAVFGHDLGLQINAGHGLHLENVQPVARLPFMTELNIGHAIVARALFVGMKAAVAEMRRAIRVRHYSLRTEEAYLGWVRRFFAFTRRHPRPRGLGTRRQRLPVPRSGQGGIGQIADVRQDPQRQPEHLLRQLPSAEHGPEGAHRDTQPHGGTYHPLAGLPFEVGHRRHPASPLYRL